MYQPYPTGSQPADLPARPPAPPSVRTAVRVMYVGAAASLLNAIIGVATVSSTKAALLKRSPNLTAAQVSGLQHALAAAAVIGGLIAIAAWIVLARNCQAGRNWARITGTVLFGIYTIDVLASAGGAVPLGVLAKVLGLLVWLCGLVTVVFLWRRDARPFFQVAR